MKLPFLILFFLVLSGASESGEPANPKETIPQGQKADLDKKEPAQQRTPADFVPPKPPIDKYPPDKQASEKKNQPWQPTGWFNLWLVIFTGCLVGVGIAQAIIYRKQTKYMRRGLRLTRIAADAAKAAANTATRQTMILEDGQRPWIMVQVDDWGSPDIHDASLGFGGVIKWSAINVGHSPAFLTDLVITSDVFAYPLPEKHPEDANPKQFAKFIIPPAGKHSSMNRALPTPIDATAMRGIFEGTHCQVLYGFVRYHDSLEKPHLTRFCVFQHRENEDWKLEPVGPPDWIEYT